MTATTMKATIFEGKNQIALKGKPVPKPGDYSGYALLV